MIRSQGFEEVGKWNFGDDVLAENRLNIVKGKDAS